MAKLDAAHGAVLQLAPAMPTKTVVFECWAASMKYKPDSHRFIAGRFFFDSENSVACRAALFKTRDEARSAIKMRTNWYTKGSPVRVRVAVEPIEGGE